MEKYTSDQPRTFKSRCIDFWFYHKWHLLVGILILFMAVMGVHSCFNKDNVDVYVLYMITGSYSENSNAALARKLEKYIDDVNGDGEKRVQVITVSFSEVLERTDRAQETTLSKMIGQVASGPALFYVMDDENFEALLQAKTEIFGDISQFGLESKHLEKHRFDATASGFLNDIDGFEQKHLYFAMRETKNIETGDHRFSQIKSVQNALRRIIESYK